MSRTLIVNARLVNEGKEFNADLLIDAGRIAKIASKIPRLPATPWWTPPDAGCCRA